ncbi:MAG TPA: TIGR02444 family protein [Aliidongia sp.]|nr:TIGR02444 family protein [Aliidongia sp.]
MTMAGEHGDFWRFTLEIYGRSQVSPRLIELQDRDGRDVNILLYCLYAGLVLGRRLGRGDIALLEQAVAGWNMMVTHKLRTIRRDLKPLAGDPQIAELRRAVQAAELDGERLAQARLQAALPERAAETPGPALARANLMAYAGESTHILADIVLS